MWVSGKSASKGLATTAMVLSIRRGMNNGVHLLAISLAILNASVMAALQNFLKIRLHRQGNISSPAAFQGWSISRQNSWHP